MNETIKTYTELTVEQAGELLRDNGWKPVEGVAFRTINAAEGNWNHANLKGISVGNGHKKFVGPHERHWAHCAKATEIDPCRAPDGCGELEPWMAYIGEGSGTKEHDAPTDLDLPSGIYWYYGKGDYAKACPDWRHGECSGGANYMAVDVRTSFAQGTFPEHCRIRAYIDPVIHRKVSGMLRDKSTDEEIREDIDRRCGFVPDAPLHMDDRQISLLAIKLASQVDFPELTQIGPRISAYYDLLKEFVKEESK